MTIRSLRSRVRPDNLKNQPRVGQTLARRIYLALLAGGVAWVIAQFIGPLFLLDAEGLVVKEREVITPSYQAQVVAVAVHPGDHVDVGQTIGHVVSAQMLDLISDLTTRQGQARARLVQIESRLKAIAVMLPSADQNVQQAADAVSAINRAKALGFATLSREAQVAKDQFTATREANGLSAEATGLKSEQAALRENLSRLDAALAKATTNYHNGTIVAPVEGTIGATVLAPGTVLTPGEKIAEIYHGLSSVVAYLPTDRLYSLRPGEEVVVSDGATRQVGHIEQIESITDKIPPEFQSNFRSIDRQQVARVTVNDPRAFPLLAKVTATNTYAPSNLVAASTGLVARGVARAIRFVSKTADQGSAAITKPQRLVGRVWPKPTGADASPSAR